MIYVCSDRGCGYRKSIPQVFANHRRSNGQTCGLRCLCGYSTYRSDEKVYVCKNGEDSDDFCGFYLHENDSLTFLDISINDDEVNDWLRKRSPKCICKENSVFKYTYDEFMFEGYLSYKCRKNKCLFVSRNIKGLLTESEVCRQILSRTDRAKRG